MDKQHISLEEATCQQIMEELGKRFEAVIMVTLNSPTDREDHAKFYRIGGAFATFGMMEYAYRRVQQEFGNEGYDIPKEA